MFKSAVSAGRAALTQVAQSVWPQAALAAILIAAGVAGVVSATQARPYTGVPATDLTQVPLRVINEPNVPALALLIVALGLAVTGAAWFVVRLVHWRFWSPVVSLRVWREAALAGVFVMSLVWLKINQALSLPLAAAVLAALVLTEIYLNVRTAARGSESA